MNTKIRIVALATLVLFGCNKAATEACEPLPYLERTFNLVWPNSPQSSLARVNVLQTPQSSSCSNDGTITVQVIHSTMGPVSFDLELALANERPWGLLAKIPRIGFNDTLTLSVPLDRDLSSGTLNATVSRVYGLVPPL